MPTTLDTLTDKQIAALRLEAIEAGDDATVIDCETALGAWPMNDYAAARARIVAVIQNAEAQQP